MNHDHYIKDLTEHQIEALVACCKTRLAQFNDAGWVYLWVVGSLTHSWAWFEDNDYVGAVTWMAARGVRMATDNKPSDMSLDRLPFRPQEAAQHLVRMGVHKASKPIGAAKVKRAAKVTA